MPPFKLSIALGDAANIEESAPTSTVMYDATG
jgi:hypothetical protein